MPKYILKIQKGINGVSLVAWGVKGSKLQTGRDIPTNVKEFCYIEAGNKMDITFDEIVEAKVAEITQNNGHRMRCVVEIESVRDQERKARINKEFWDSMEDEWDETEDQDIGFTFRNFYRHCGVEWDDVWSCTVNDKCPKCGAEIEPYLSEDVEDEIEGREYFGDYPVTYVQGRPFKYDGRGGNSPMTEEEIGQIEVKS